LNPDKPSFLVKYMPIYEYRCESCGAELEKIQKFSDAPLTDCPACGKASLKKLVSASSFRLKGTGWYETDFKNKNKSSSDAKTSAAAGAAGKAGNNDKDSSASEKSGDTGSENSKNKKDGSSSNGSSNGSSNDKGSGKASGNSSKDSSN